MTDQDEFDRLRARIETLEDEAGIDTESEEERLFPEDQYVWVKTSRGTTDYYAAPSDIVSMMDDGCRDRDVSVTFRRVVRAGSLSGAEIEEDYERLTHEGFEFMSRSDVLDEVDL